MGSSSQPSIPPAPDYGKLYQGGIDAMLANYQKLLDAEESARSTTDPMRIADQQALQDKYGPIQVQQQLDALHKFDPESAAIRADLAKHVQDDLASGYDLPPAYAREIEQDVRGAQAARGNILGNAPASIEAGLKGKAALDLYQQHLTNAGSFLAGPTPEQQSLAIQAVQPDRSMAYVNPGAGAAGANFGLANYQNLLAQYQLSGQGGGNVWQRALNGARIGGSQGSVGGVWGALGGAAGGAIDGAVNGPIYQYQTNPYYSDSRLKENIKHICVSMMGIPMVSFNYKGRKQRFIGALAEDVKRVRPDAVTTDDKGYLKVDYSKLDIPLYELEEANTWRG